MTTWLLAEQTHPKPSTFDQWRALSGRYVRDAVRGGEWIIALLGPLIFLLGYYVPLKRVMEINGLNYAQFLLPIIALQGVALTATSVAMRSAKDSVLGITNRFATMPMRRSVPIGARMSVAMSRCLISVLAAVAYGHIVGFRFHGDLLMSVTFILLLLWIGFAFCMGAEGLGSISKSPQATSQSLTLPVLILGMLSTGFIPEGGFPSWIRPFVRNQPISQFSETLRGLTNGTATVANSMATLLWVSGLTVGLAAFALWATGRRN